MPSSPPSPANLRYRVGTPCLVALISCVACTASDPPATADTLEPRPAIGTADTTAARGLSLTLDPVHDTVGRGDPVWVVRAIDNAAGVSVGFSNDPNYYWYDVRNPRGLLLSPEPTPKYSISGDVPVLTLPENAALIQRLDLSCVRYPYTLRADSPCEYGFRFSEAGDYTVTAYYKPPSTKARIPNYVELKSNSVVITVR